jgi:hypothetical protein
MHVVEYQVQVLLRGLPLLLVVVGCAEPASMT